MFIDYLSMNILKENTPELCIFNESKKSHMNCKLNKCSLNVFI